MPYRIVFLSLFLLVIAAGCSGDEATCSTDDDCFAGEQCRAGSCTTDSSNNNMSTTDTGNNPTTNNVATDMGGSDMSTGSDAGDDAGVEADAGDDAGSIEWACVVDPFDVEACPDDENDRFAERFVERTVGCQNDGFDAVDLTRTERLCALETADKYSVSIIECDNRIHFDVTFRPLVSCNPDDINLAISIQGKNCAEQANDPDVQCSWQPDGSYLAQFLVDDGRSIASARIDLDVDPRSDIDFEYEMTVEVYE